MMSSLPDHILCATEGNLAEQLVTLLLCGVGFLHIIQHLCVSTMFESGNSL